jgi:hypothetical protein
MYRHRQSVSLRHAADTTDNTCQQTKTWGTHELDASSRRFAPIARDRHATEWAVTHRATGDRRGNSGSRSRGNAPLIKPAESIRFISLGPHSTWALGGQSTCGESPYSPHTTLARPFASSMKVTVSFLTSKAGALGRGLMRLGRLAEAVEPLRWHIKFSEACPICEGLSFTPAYAWRSCWPDSSDTRTLWRLWTSRWIYGLTYLICRGRCRWRAGFGRSS